MIRVLAKPHSAYIEFIQDVLITIHENLRELDERRSFAETAELAHIDGKIQAYREMLSILRMSAEQAGLPGREIGL